MPDRPAPASRAAQAAPTPLAPTAGETAPLDAVTFRWSAPPGKASYTLRVASASAPDAVLVELAGLPTTEATLADALPAGPALWWVQREGGAWSAPAQFVAGTPADLEVAQRAAATRADRQRDAERAGRRLPGLAPLPPAPADPVWPHATGAALDDAPAFDWTTAPGFGPPSRTDAAPVEAEPPRPLGPLGGEVVDAAAVALRWRGVPGAEAYEVELSPHTAFDRDVLALDAGRATELSLPGLMPAVGHRLLWRVRARTPAGPTPWSRYGRFYPAPDAAVDRFRLGLDAAHAARRRQEDHARLADERALDLIPLHERPDAVTSAGAAAAIVVMSLSGVLLMALAALFAIWYL